MKLRVTAYHQGIVCCGLKHHLVVVKNESAYTEFVSLSVAQIDDVAAVIFTRLPTS